MGVFSFMETFFFISLGITFVLIIMLVYHFKQRIIALEQKHDTMFDIVNNIVKQLRTMQSNIQHLGENQIPITQTFVPYFSENTQIDSGAQSIVGAVAAASVTDSGSDSEDEDSGSEDDDDDSGSEDSEDDDDESVHSVTVVMTNKIVVSDDEEPLVELPPVVSVDETLGKSVIESVVLDSVADVVDDVVDDVTGSALPYKKMNLNQLKAAVVAKGLHADPSKMKKPELLKLLETENSSA
jgi:hypothetical protein